MNNIKVGDKVILGAHDFDGPYRGNWNDAMDPYVGKVATVIQYISTGGDRSGIATCQVDIDGGRFFWRVKNMTPPGPQNDGATCDSCHNFFPYAVSAPNFKCWSCKNF